MRTSLATFMLLAALVLGLLAAMGIEQPPEEPPAGPAASPAPLLPPTTASRPTSPVRSQRLAVPVAPLATCTGRCVDWQSGDAIEGCRVAVLDGAGVTSDAHGHFVLNLAVDALAAEVTVAAADRLTITRRVGLIAGTLALGDVRLHPAAQVRGVLRDDNGQPCPNVLVHVACGSRAARRDGWLDRFRTQARTTADGSFEFAQPLPAGLVVVTVPGLPPLLGSSNFLLERGSQYMSLTCRSWRAQDTITGIVRDRFADGVGQALVQAFGTRDDADPPAAWAHADAHGRFRLIRREGMPDAVWLSAVTRQLASGVGANDQKPTPWGATDVTIEVPAGHGVSLQVVDAQTGEPIEGYGVQCVATAGVRSASAGARRDDGRHEGGWCWLDGLATGPHQLIAWPHDQRWLPNLPQTFDLEQSGGVVRVALARAVPCPVQVVSAAGKPLAGVNIDLLAPAAANLERDLEQLLEHGGSRAPATVRLAHAVTDADGKALLRWFADPRRLDLRVHGNSMAPHLETDVQLDAHGLTVQVAPTARLLMQLHGAGGSRLSLNEVDGPRQLPAAWSEPLLLDERGTLAVDVPAGRWQATLWTRATTGNALSAPWLPLPEPFATLTTQAGTSQRLELDLRAALALGEYRGSAFVDGEPARHLVLLCGERAGDGSMRVLHTVAGHADRHGGFQFTDLHAGYYALQLRVTCTGQQVAVPIADWRRLQPAECLTHEPVALRTTEVSVRLHATTEQAVVSGQLTLRADSGIALRGAPDRTGLVRFDRVPHARYRLQLRHESGAVDLGWLVVEGSAPCVHSVEVR